jgi:hypothetical protein
MTVDLAGNIINIARNRIIALDNARGTTIVCVRGSLWITEQRGSEDVLLEPGERYVLTGNGKALVTALEVGAIKLIEPVSLARSTMDALVGAFVGWWTRQYDQRAMNAAARRYGVAI